MAPPAPVSLRLTFCKFTRCIWRTSSVGAVCSPYTTLISLPPPAPRSVPCGASGAPPSARYASASDGRKRCRGLIDLRFAIAALRAHPCGAFSVVDRRKPLSLALRSREVSRFSSGRTRATPPASSVVCPTTAALLGGAALAGGLIRLLQSRLRSSFLTTAGPPSARPLAGLRCSALTSGGR